MISKKKHLKILDDIRSNYNDALKVIEESYETRLNQEYNRAVQEIRSQLRTWLVDLNWEMFHTDSKLIRAKLNGAIASALAQFHEKTPIVSKEKTDES